MLVAVVGATGTGKSALALDLAERLVSTGSTTGGGSTTAGGSTTGGGSTTAGGEIVNADAMQFYRGMDIGTAKTPPSERRGIPHHLLDTLDVSQEASVADYQLDARAVIETAPAPILVGGSGLYVSSVIYDFEFPGTDPEVRATLEAELTDRGPGLLFQRLVELDPAAAASIGPSNGRRIVRALEVIELTGQPFGSGLPSEEKYWTPTVVIGLQAPRDELVHRLDRRVEQMWADGLVDEAGSLGKLGVTAARAIGYAQALDQIAGELTEGQAIEQAQALTRRYARRQVGWFRRYPGVTWLDFDDPDRVEKAMSAIENASSAAATMSE